MAIALVTLMLGILFVYAGVTGRPLSQLIFGKHAEPQPTQTLTG